MSILPARLCEAPKWSLSGVADYSRSITDPLDGFVRPNGFTAMPLPAIWKPWLRHDWVSQLPLREPAYNWAYLRAGLNFDGFSLNAYAENFFKENYLTNPTILVWAAFVCILIRALLA